MADDDKKKKEKRSSSPEKTPTEALGNGVTPSSDAEVQSNVTTGGAKPSKYEPPTNIPAASPAASTDGYETVAFTKTKDQARVELLTTNNKDQTMLELLKETEKPVTLRNESQEDHVYDNDSGAKTRSKTANPSRLSATYELPVPTSTTSSQPLGYMALHGGHTPQSEYCSPAPEPKQHQNKVKKKFEFFRWTTLMVAVSIFVAIIALLFSFIALGVSANVKCSCEDLRRDINSIRLQIDNCSKFD